MTCTQKARSLFVYTSLILYYILDLAIPDQVALKKITLSMKIEEFDMFLSVLVRYEFNKVINRASLGETKAEHT
jgi:hypothetical protein